MGDDYSLATAIIELNDTILWITVQGKFSEVVLYTIIFVGCDSTF